MKYLLTVEVEIWKLKARSCSGRLRRSFKRVKKTHFKGRSFFWRLCELSLVPQYFSWLTAGRRRSNKATKIQKMGNQCRIAQDNCQQHCLPDEIVSLMKLPQSALSWHFSAQGLLYEPKELHLQCPQDPFFFASVKRWRWWWVASWLTWSACNRFAWWCRM